MILDIYKSRRGCYTFTMPRARPETLHLHCLRISAVSVHNVCTIQLFVMPWLHSKLCEQALFLLLK